MTSPLPVVDCIIPAAAAAAVIACPLSDSFLISERGEEPMVSLWCRHLAVVDGVRWIGWWCHLVVRFGVIPLSPGGCMCPCDLGECMCTG